MFDKRAQLLFLDKDALITDLETSDIDASIGTSGDTSDLYMSPRQHEK